MNRSKINTLPDRYQGSLDDRILYARPIALLMYAILGTRVDVVYFVSFLSRYLRNLSLQHICATKRIMYYCRRTTKLEFTFCGDLKPLVRYTNLDLVEDIETRRSTSGFLFNIGSRAISCFKKTTYRLFIFLQSRISCANSSYQGGNLAKITFFSAFQE